MAAAVAEFDYTTKKRDTTIAYTTAEPVAAVFWGAGQTIDGTVTDSNTAGNSASQLNTLTVAFADKPGAFTTTPVLASGA